MGRSADNRENVSHTKNQHYVSRLYLRQFAFEAGKNPRIYTFDKTARRVIRPSIRNIAAEMHFYESSDTGIERALTDLLIRKQARTLDLSTDAIREADRYTRRAQAGVVSKVLETVMMKI
jgi:hypothetical protein